VTRPKPIASLFVQKLWGVATIRANGFLARSPVFEGGIRVRDIITIFVVYARLGETLPGKPLIRL